jgi:hypothetical protein
MATTSEHLTAGAAIGGRGGDGKGGVDLKARLAMGLAILGCAGALAFGGLRVADRPATQPAGEAGFAAPAASAFAGTDDLALIGCVQVPGPFGCAPATEVVPPFEAATATEYRWGFVSDTTAMQVHETGGYLVGAPNERVPSDTGVGPQEHLPGEGSAMSGGSAPTPDFGPQP